MKSTLVSIPDCYTCRGMTFLPQQFVGPVPRGEYELAGPIDVDYSDLGKPTRTTAELLVNTATAERWYVSPYVAKFLLEEHSIREESGANE